MKEELNTKDIIEALGKRWKLIVIVLLTCILIASIFTFFIVKPTYESSTSLFIGKETDGEKAYNQSEITMYQKLLKTYGEVIKTKDLAKVVAKNIDIDIQPNTILNNVSVIPVSDTQIIQIKYTSKSSYEAAVILNEIKNEFIKIATELVPNVNIQVLEEVAENRQAISPNKTMNIAIAGLFGLMLGIGIVFLLEFLDNTFKSKETLENELGIPVIGVIPNLVEGVNNGRTSN